LFLVGVIADDRSLLKSLRASMRRSAIARRTSSLRSRARLLGFAWSPPSRRRQRDEVAGGLQGCSPTWFRCCQRWLGWPGPPGTRRSLWRRLLVVQWGWLERPKAIRSAR